MNPTFTLLNCLLIFCLSISNLSAQETRYQQIIVETEEFSNDELEDLERYLKTQHSFEVLASCPDEGLILVGFPTSLPVRVPHAEEQITAAVQQIWQRKSTISRQKTSENVIQCDQ